ncbi:Glutathione S-transferase [Minicystis rosea]|nr:Glutathione S-transferase [Minicystis rosea]
MTYIIHGARGSGSSIVEAACAAVGADYQVRDLNMRAEEQRGDAYASLNPQRKIPALEVDGREIITESVAILLTLDERHRHAGLLPPPGSPQRAEALRWMLFAATELYPIIEIVDYPERFAPSPESKEDVRARAKEIWHQRWLVLEKNLAGTPYCVESGFSATDLYIAVLSRWDLADAFRREHLPKVEALTAAVRARPAIAPVWTRHFG